MFLVLMFCDKPLPFAFGIAMYGNAEIRTATGNLVAIAGSRETVRFRNSQIMPRKSRENSIEEKRRIRNERRKSKRLSRTAMERENTEIRTQKERDAHSRAKELARIHYDKWKAFAEQNNRSLDKKQGKALLVQI